LQAAGCQAFDEGDIAIPSYLPHHGIPPIRSWPGPRIAWDHVSERIAPLLRQPGHIPLLIGCDCSIVVGTTQALTRESAGDVHVLYVDGDFDDAAPDPEHCRSAAALAVWLLTHASPFWAGPPLRSSQVTVIGWSSASQAGEPGVRAIPVSASVLLHFDIDVLQRRDMPAAYFPHADGLTLSEATELLAGLLQDSAALRDLDQRGVTGLKPS
jgi:arginase